MKDWSRLNKHNYIDMWYMDNPADATNINIMFADCDCVYRGNIWIEDKIVGDYQAADFQTVQAMFPQFDWKAYFKAQWEREERELREENELREERELREPENKE